MNTTLIPLYDQVVVKKNDAPAATESGFVLAATNSNKGAPAIGTVVAVGSGRITLSGQLAPLALEVGDQIYFSPNDGFEITHEGETVLILSDANVLAKIVAQE